MTNSKQKPVAKVQMYPITAAIWKNTNDDGQSFYSFTLERTYKKSNGHYDSTSSFNAGDALLLAKAADQVDTKIRELRQADHDAASEAA